MKKFLMSLAAIVLVVGMFAPVTFADDHSEGDMAMVRVLHASPNAPAVDVYVDGNVVVEGADFKAATDYMELPAGEHMVEIYAAGTMGEQDPVISTNVTVEAGMAYTIAAINSLENIELKAIQDEMTVSEGMAKVRVGHLIPGAPTVDVGMIEGDALFAGAEFPMITEYSEVEPGTYDLEVRTIDGTQLLDLSGTMLEAGMVYSAFAVGTAESPDVLVLANTASMSNSDKSDSETSDSETSDSNEDAGMSDSDTTDSETSDSNEESDSDTNDSGTTDSNMSDSETDDSMPSSMPETGFGGTADSGNNALMYASILGVIAMGVGFVLFRRRFEA